VVYSNHHPKRKLSKYFGLLAVLTILMIPAYAEVVKPTDKGTINVAFATDPANPNPGDQTLLKIRFLNKQNSVQPHIDYNVTVTKGTDRAFSTGNLHVGEGGSISIPFQFQDTGTYQITVEVDGILFQPIPPETATFTINVGSANQSSCGPISIPHWVKKNAGWWSQNSIDDATFAQGIQYLIKHGIIKIPPTQSGQGTSGTQIPQWVKKNAGWWSGGQIDDCTFVHGIQYMIQNGFIKV